MKTLSTDFGVSFRKVWSRLAPWIALVAVVRGMEIAFREATIGPPTRAVWNGIWTAGTWSIVGSVFALVTVMGFVWIRRMLR